MTSSAKIRLIRRHPQILRAVGRKPFFVRHDGQPIHGVKLRISADEADER